MSDFNPLLPNRAAPLPLDENFYLKYLSDNNSVKNGSLPTIFHVANPDLNRSLSDTVPRVRAQPIVEKLIRENQQLIEQETLKQVAPEAVNVAAHQYQNLIPLSFDEEELIRQEEQRRRKKRERAAAAAGVKK